MNVKEKIHMVDLVSQYQKLKPEIDKAIEEICTSTQFINGPAVRAFESNLAQYLKAEFVIGCANGTDALQIALMALGLKPGDDIIVPAFTYVATAEVIGLLNLNPIMVDVDLETFNVTADFIEKAITPNTKAIVPVHLFGQSADMEPILELARTKNLFVIEDNAQAIGAEYIFSNGKSISAGTMGDIGTTSFYPAKNLGAYGDAGAIFTNDELLQQKIKMIANHGQDKRYHHSMIGCNSRLDSIQAAILDIKLKHLNNYAEARQAVAKNYDDAFKDISALSIPKRQYNSSHVFHQYTLTVKDGRRNLLIDHLKTHEIPCGVYYPIPLYQQKAFSKYVPDGFELNNTKSLCQSVISLPIHPDMKPHIQDYIIETVNSFFR